MTYEHFKREGWLYALAFILAIGLRFIQLGAMPLTDIEAAPALQALQIAQGLKPALSPYPFYIPVSYTHLRAHETVLDLVCRLLLEKKKQQTN